MPQQTARLDSSERYIHVEAAIPSYRAEGSLKYLYKLEGLDSEWKTTTRLQPFTFSNLNPGSYVFRLKTSYKKRISANQASLSFVIPRPYYQDPFFLGAVTLVVLGLAFSWHRFRTGAIEKARLKLEEKVQRRTADLQSANRELEAFNLAVTNNLKVPVRHIIGFSDIARSREYAERRDHYLNRIHHNALSLNEMIGDLHDLALAGSILLNPSAINLSLETRIIAGKLKKDHPEYTAEVIIEDDIIAYCDDRLMRIVLKNLLSNAFKATMHLEEGVIQLNSRKNEEGQTVYIVKDNGIGLDEAQKNLLFKPFTQIHNPDVFPGKGLGLVIVQRIINRHRGEVWVKTAAGQGFTLHFTLPGEEK
jgi:signal transduction histidine kinase